VVGTRSACFAPRDDLAAIVLLDGDDEAHESTANPHWTSRDVLVERARRSGAGLWITSAVPSPTLLARAPRSTNDVGQGDFWPTVVRVDRRLHDPREGALSRVALDAVHDALNSSEAVAAVVVLPRLGRARWLACRRCGELQRCSNCRGPERLSDENLVCGEGHEHRGPFCRFCSSTALRQVRSGVTTLARDVAAQCAQPVSEVTATTSPSESLTRVVVGTDAVFTRLRRSAVVVFADFDQYLLAPRERARRDALSAVARAGRLVGPRIEGRGSVILQTRQGADAVLDAAESGDPWPVVDEDRNVAQLLNLPPFRARATIVGEGASEFVSTLEGLEIFDQGEEWIVSGPTVEALCDELSRHRRRAGVRIAVR
jgi:primosomal protein N' (replication factor Y)